VRTEDSKPVVGAMLNVSREILATDGVGVI
jgi:hypothetical protein